jgi:predicted nuclease of predicted toxin-antitoxin system
MARWLADENFRGDFVRGLRLRKGDLDILRAQDVGLEGAGDDAVLAWAASNNRIVLTHDRATMPDFAYARVGSGQRMPGLLVLNDRMSVNLAIRELLLAETCADESEWNGLVVYLPL